MALSSCSPNSSEEFQQEGKARCQALVAHLKKIESREQLLRSEGVLKRQFESLVKLMIDAREFQQKHLELEWVGDNAELLLDLKKSSSGST